LASTNLIAKQVALNGYIQSFPTIESDISIVTFTGTKSEQRTPQTSFGNLKNCYNKLIGSGWTLSLCRFPET
jgi:hypothetical protein